MNRVNIKADSFEVQSALVICCHARCPNFANLQPNTRRAKKGMYVVVKEETFDYNKETRVLVAFAQFYQQVA